MDSSYLDLLNEQQRDAVIYKDGPSLVIAGAGSGKTRVLTYKIVDLLANGYEPYRILALTFTNKAAREMKERVAAAVGEKTAAKLWMGTFHSIFLRILRSHADLLGYKRDFTIYDASDAKSLVKLIIKDLQLDDKVYKPATISAIISNAKNSLISPDAYLADRETQDIDRRSKRPMTGMIYSIYNARCRKASAMDFDDILFNMNLLLRDNPDICRHYQEFFRYILVDEYQDTNFAQHLIITRLAGTAQKVCVVGDDAQSIYSFRGANIANILNLKATFPGLKIFKLEQNYRSTQNIVNAAGSLIEKNTRQMPKNVFSRNEEGEPIEILSTYSDMEEAFLIANRISAQQLTCHDSLDDYAVLYRTNAQSRQLEESLRRRNIPYRIYGGLSFYQRKEVKDALCYFRVAVNPDDDEALRRIINYPARGIGETTLKKLTHAAISNESSIWYILQNPTAYTDINKGTATKLNGFRELIASFLKMNESGADAFCLGEEIIGRTGMLAILAHDKTPESISKKENLEEILKGLDEFVDSRREAGESNFTMTDFLSEVSLATDQDSQEETNEPKVTLMTVHAAKGLEFPHVYIAGVEEELLPSAMSMNTLSEVEEERRLLYVAITRAEKTCVITYATSRFRNGQPTATRPSRFLLDLDPAFIKSESSAKIGSPSPFINPRVKLSPSQRPKSRMLRPGKYGDSGIPLSAFTDRSAASGTTSQQPAAGNGPVSRDALSVGMQITHSRFGKGKILSINDYEGDTSITVDFRQLGVKKLLLRFARFTIDK